MNGEMMEIQNNSQLNNKSIISGLSEEQGEKVEELVRRIYEKNDSKRANELILLIKQRGYSYAEYLMSFYDDIHMKYDNVFYGEMVNGVLFVEKNGYYGITDKDGNEIIPCKFKKYSDAYHEWEDLGFPKAPVIATGEQLVMQMFKDGLNRKHDELASSGHIKQITFFKKRTINGAEFVTMSDGSIGIAAAVVAYDSERGKNLEIKNADGEHVMFLSEPELLQGIGTPGVVICSDENNLYVGSYGNEYSYIACYRMGDFERVWKTPLYGSRIQSITVNDDELIAFDMEDGKIKYFDKHSGKRNADKQISTEKDIGPLSVKSHHNLAATNERLLAGVPGLTLGLLSFENELKVFDNASGESIAQKNVSLLAGTLQSLTIDQQNNRIFIAFDNKIAVFGDNGYEGYFLAPTRNVHQLNFDQETGCLMISLTEGEGKVEIYSPDAVTSLLQTSRELKSKIEHQILDVSTGILGISGGSQIQSDETQNLNRHTK